MHPGGLFLRKLSVVISPLRLMQTKKREPVVVGADQQSVRSWEEMKFL